MNKLNSDELKYIRTLLMYAKSQSRCAQLLRIAEVRETTEDIAQEFTDNIIYSIQESLNHES